MTIVIDKKHKLTRVCERTILFTNSFSCEKRMLTTHQLNFFLPIRELNFFLRKTKRRGGFVEEKINLTQN